MRIFSYCLLLLSNLVLLIDRTESAAAPIYSALAQVSGSGFADPGSGNDTQRVAAGMFSFRSAQARAAMGVGSMSGFVEAKLVGNLNGEDTVPSGFASARAGGFMLIDDMIVSRRPGFEGLPSRLNTTAHLTFSADTDLAALTEVSGGINGATGFSLEDGATLDSTAEVEVDQPFVMTLTTTIRARVENEARTERGFFSLSLGGSPVFELPEGYTANSASAQIVDNFYVGPSIRVPEPSSGLLMMLLCVSTSLVVRKL